HRGAPSRRGGVRRSLPIPTPGVLAGGPAAGLRRVALDDVPLFQVVVPGEADAALEVPGDLADVVAEPAERVDLVRGDDLATVPDARTPVPADRGARDVVERE